MTKRKEIIINLCIIFAIVSVVVFIFWPKNTTPERPPMSEYELEYAAMRSLFSHCDLDFYESLTFETKEDANGNLHPICVLSPELDGILDELVAAYNADPNVEHKATEDDLRLWLTEDIGRAANRDSGESALKEFISWTNAPADLVDKNTGDGVNQGAVSNYGAVRYPEDIVDKVFSWDYEASK